MGNRNVGNNINESNQNLINRPESDVSLMINDGPLVKRIFAIKNPVYLKRNSLILERNSNERNIYYIKFQYDALVDMNVNIIFFANKNSSNHGPPYYVPVDRPYDSIKSVFNLPRGQNQEFFDLNASFDISIFTQPLQASYDVVIEFIPIFSEDIRNNSERNNLNVSPDSEILFYTMCKVVVEDNNVAKIRTEMQRLRSQGMWFDLYEVFNSALETGECLICCTNIRNTIFLPCKHSCCCHTCSHSLRMRNNPCPICKICKSFNQMFL